jgi:hypothetical protein
VHAISTGHRRLVLAGVAGCSDDDAPSPSPGAPRVAALEVVEAETHDTGYHELPGCNGIGHDATYVWVCAGPKQLARVDPSTGQVLMVDATKRSDEGRLAFVDGLLWFIESGTTDLVGLDEEGRPAATIPLGEACTDLAFDDTDVFVLCPGSTSVKRLEVGAREVPAP